MRFLIDANMPRSTRGVILSAGHDAIDVRDIGMGAAADTEIAKFAQNESLAIITRDRGFENRRKYPPKLFAGIVVINLRYDAVAVEVLALLNEFMKNQELLDQLPGRTALIRKTSVRFRQT